MGSVLDITLPDVGAEQGNELLRAAFAEASRIERLLSVFDAASELSRVNREAPRGPVNADPELLGLIEQARRYWVVSGGTVDATVSPLTRAWRVRDDRHGGVPLRPLAGDEVEGLRQGVGFNHVEIDPLAGTVVYRDPRVELEFGAFGKGYAVDRIGQLLRAAGVSSALVDFGSTAYAIGKAPGEDCWRVGIRHPRDPNRVLAVVRLSDNAVSTSGDDQQVVIVRGIRYGHIIDPRTGRPSHHVASASVIARTALEADALSTAAFVYGAREGVGLLRRLGVDGLIVGDGETGLWTEETPGWRAFTDQPRLLVRRRVLAGLAAAVLGMFVRPPLGWAVVYMSREEALRALIPEATQFTPQTVALTDSQREQIGSLTGRRTRDAEVAFWIAQGDGRPLGYATVLDEIGKEQPITFMVAVAPEGVVRGVQVLIFRESQGSEIRSKRFLSQFVGKTLDAPLRLGRDIHNMSGATLSSRSTAFVVRKALALVKVVYGDGANPP
jgi:thiamine biosynthesis lipoprotein